MPYATEEWSRRSVGSNGAVCYKSLHSDVEEMSRCRPTYSRTEECLSPAMVCGRVFTRHHPQHDFTCAHHGCAILDRVVSCHICVHDMLWTALVSAST